MSGSLRFFGIAALLGGLIGAAYFALQGDFNSPQVQLLVLACGASGVFWFVLLLAVANIHQWVMRLAEDQGLLD